MRQTDDLRRRNLILIACSLRHNLLMKFGIDFRLTQSYAIKNQRKKRTKNPKQKKRFGCQISNYVYLHVK
jgi:hypothetical protein